MAAVGRLVAAEGAPVRTVVSETRRIVAGRVWGTVSAATAVAGIVAGVVD